MAVGSIAADDLATQLYVDPGDVCVILATLTAEPVEDVWVPRSVSRTLISGFAVGRSITGPGYACMIASCGLRFAYSDAPPLLHLGRSKN